MPYEPHRVRRTDADATSSGRRPILLVALLALPWPPPPLIDGFKCLEMSQSIFEADTLTPGVQNLIGRVRTRLAIAIPSVLRRQPPPPSLSLSLRS